jgi:hypothetical protein
MQHPQGIRVDDDDDDDDLSLNQHRRLWKFQLHYEWWENSELDDEAFGTLEMLSDLTLAFRR